MLISKARTKWFWILGVRNTGHTVISNLTIKENIFWIHTPENKLKLYNVDQTLPWKKHMHSTCRSNIGPTHPVFSGSIHSRSIFLPLIGKHILDIIHANCTGHFYLLFRKKKYLCLRPLSISGKYGNTGCGVFKRGVQN